MAMQANVATIALGASLSGAVPVNGAMVVALEMPAAWTAAVLTFQASSDGTTYRDVYDSSGTEISLTVAASRYVRLTPADWCGVKYLKVRSGTAASAVNQEAARSINIITQDL